MADEAAGDRRVIEVRNLLVRYGEETILEDLNLDVTRGEILVIAGSSGCGKSTLLRHMVGLAVPSGGTIAINGWILPLHRRRRCAG